MTPVVGYHAIEESIRSATEKGELYVSGAGGRTQRLVDASRALGIRVHFVDKAELDRISRGGDHRGAVYLASEAHQPVFREFNQAVSSIEGTCPFVLLLDQITDPHNLGAILRSADMFYADLVVLPARRTAHVNATVIKTSAGASNYVTLSSVANLVRALTDLKKAGYWVYGAAMEGEPAHSLDLTGPVALVLGSEGEGLKRLVREACDGLIAIPTSGHVDSLNVSVAAGICMYEIRRQQGFA
jgi:23S rRNA (guanosine2251-2'-O)-methyltransferase